MIDAYEKAVLLAHQALRRGDMDACFSQLERAHVLAQRFTLRHTYVHWLMLKTGLRSRDWREVMGQLPRIMASVLFSRLWVPPGNTGRARVGAFAAMPIPEELKQLLRRR